MTTTCACITTLHSIAVRQNRINEKEETSASTHIYNTGKHIVREATAAEMARIEIKTNRVKRHEEQRIRWVEEGGRCTVNR
jgi:heterodisulfide reductase subunit C